MGRALTRGTTHIQISIFYSRSVQILFTSNAQISALFSCFNAATTSTFMELSNAEIHQKNAATVPPACSSLKTRFSAYLHIFTDRDNYKGEKNKSQGIKRSHRALTRQLYQTGLSLECRPIRQNCRISFQQKIPHVLLLFNLL